MAARAMEYQENEMYKLVAAMTPLRRDIWASHEAAIEWMKVRPPFNMWDPRVFDIYVVR